jgi:hypothetical protein
MLKDQVALGVDQWCDSLEAALSRPLALKAACRSSEWGLNG